MQCVILAAGKGTRLMPYTKNRPKPLVEVAGKPLIEHVIDSLPTAVEELIVVIGHMGDQIRHHLSDQIGRRKVNYVEQKHQNGTARALWLCREHLEGRFLFMFADDIHGSEDISRATTYVRSMLVATSPAPEKFGVVLRNADGTLAEIVEKPEHPASNLVSTGVMVLDRGIFNYDLLQSGKPEEHYLTSVLPQYAMAYPMAVVEQQLWLPIGYPEDIKRAEDALKGR